LGGDAVGDRKQRDELAVRREHCKRVFKQKPEHLCRKLLSPKRNSLSTLRELCMDLKSQLLAAGLRAAEAQPEPGPRPSDPKDSKQVRVSRQTQGRAGKAVTVVSGLQLGEHELAQLALALKQLCGAGGTLRDGLIEVQGEHRDRVLAELVRRGFSAKRAGG